MQSRSVLSLREQLRASVRMLTPADWAQGQNAEGRDPSAVLGQYRSDGRVFAVTTDRTELYPAFQFDAERRPLPVLQRILAVVPDDAKTWPLLSWFNAPNARLKGHRPREALASEPDAVLAAARRFYSPDD